MIYTKTTIMNCNGKMVIGGREIDAKGRKIEINGNGVFIDGITADDDTNTRWYDLNGMLLNGKPSVSGVYMRSTYDANTGMTVTRKVVLK